jgi:hypothetical protein
MSKRFIYAGIGSRKTPKPSLDLMHKVAAFLAREGWILRSGGAVGADTSFEEGCNSAGGEKEIFVAPKIRALDDEWAYQEAEKHIPANRPPFATWKPFTRALIARNMMQVLGLNGDSPVDMIVCWTQADVQDGGGTGYAMRCAASRNIPIYNLNTPADLARVESWLKGEKIDA